MAKFVALYDFDGATQRIPVGAILDDGQDDIAALRAAGAGIAPFVAGMQPLIDEFVQVAKRTGNAAGPSLAAHLSSAGFPVGDATDPAALHTDVADEFDALAEKAVLVDADLVVIEDSEAGGAKKKVQVVNLPGGGGGGAGPFFDGGTHEEAVSGVIPAGTNDVALIPFAVPAGANKIIAIKGYFASSQEDLNAVANVGGFAGMAVRTADGTLVVEDPGVTYDATEGYQANSVLVQDVVASGADELTLRVQNTGKANGSIRAAFVWAVIDSPTTIPNLP